ncbi:hypothetical protein Esti_005543 [Eimeria stiedai]
MCSLLQRAAAVVAAAPKAAAALPRCCYAAATPTRAAANGIRTLTRSTAKDSCLSRDAHKIAAAAAAAAAAAFEASEQSAPAQHRSRGRRSQQGVPGDDGAAATAAAATAAAPAAGARANSKTTAAAKHPREQHQPQVGKAAADGATAAPDRVNGQHRRKQQQQQQQQEAEDPLSQPSPRREVRGGEAAAPAKTAEAAAELDATGEHSAAAPGAAESGPTVYDRFPSMGAAAAEPSLRDALMRFKKAAKAANEETGCSAWCVADRWPPKNRIKIGDQNSQFGPLGRELFVFNRRLPVVRDRGGSRDPTLAFCCGERCVLMLSEAEFEAFMNALPWIKEQLAETKKRI